MLEWLHYMTGKVAKLSTLFFFSLLFLQFGIPTARAQWNITVVDRGGDPEADPETGMFEGEFQDGLVGRYSAIALDPSGKPFIIYYYESEGGEPDRCNDVGLPDSELCGVITLQREGASGWVGRIGAGLRTNTPGEKPNIVFIGGEAFVVSYSIFVGVEPDTDDTCTPGDGGWECPEEQRNSLYYGRWSPATSRFSGFTPIPNTSHRYAVAGGQTVLHVSHQRGSPFSCGGAPLPENSLVHRWRKPDGSWGCKQISSAAIAGPQALSIDSTGRAHVAYTLREGATCKMRYQRSTPPTVAGSYSWTGANTFLSPGLSCAVADPNQINLSMALDQQSNPHLCAYEPLGKSLWHFYLDPANQWVSDLIDGTRSLTDLDDVGNFCDIAIDASNRMHVSYYDDQNDRLKYATKVVGQNGDWQKMIVDDPEEPGDVGQYSSVAADNNGRVHISYYEEATSNPPPQIGHNLKYATASFTSSRPSSCGNGMVEAGETCDDRNTFANDGCSPSCQTEPSPGIVVCGDGSCSGGETATTCAADCTIAFIPDEEEERGATTGGGGGCLQLTPKMNFQLMLWILPIALLLSFRLGSKK